MDCESVIKMAWRNSSVFLMSVIRPASPLLSLLLYFCPLILSTAALCAIALVDIIPHETETDPAEQIAAIWLQWLMAVDRHNDPVCSQNNYIPSTSQAFDNSSLVAYHDHIMPKESISLEYGDLYDAESVLESDSEEEDEEETSTEEQEVCERTIKSHAALLDFITSELHEILMAAQNFMVSTLSKWQPVISSIMTASDSKHTQENRSGDPAHVHALLLKLQNISVHLHEELDEDIPKFPEDYRQTAALGRQSNTSAESCKLHCQRKHSDISFESFSGIQEKYDAEDAMWMQDYSSSDEEKASECSISDRDSSSLLDLEKTLTARNPTNFPDQLLRDDRACHRFMEPAGIPSEAIISRHDRPLNSSKKIVSTEQDATLYTEDDAVPAGIKLVQLDSSKDAETSEESHPPTPINMVSDEEVESSNEDTHPSLIIYQNSTTARLKKKYSQIRAVKSWPTLQEELSTRSKESFPYLIKTGMSSISSISMISKHSFLYGSQTKTTNTCLYT